MLNGKQCRSTSVGFFRSQLIWIYTVCKGRTYLGSAGLGLKLMSPYFFWTLGGNRGGGPNYAFSKQGHVAYHIKSNCVKSLKVLTVINEAGLGVVISVGKDQYQTFSENFHEMPNLIFLKKYYKISPPSSSWKQEMLVLSEHKDIIINFSSCVESIVKKKDIKYS